MAFGVWCYIHSSKINHTHGLWGVVQLLLPALIALPAPLALAVWLPRLLLLLLLAE